MFHISPKSLFKMRIASLTRDPVIGQPEGREGLLTVHITILLNFLSCFSHQNFQMIQHSSKKFIDFSLELVRVLVQSEAKGIATSVTNKKL